MKYWSNILKWIDRNALFGLTAFLLAFIPLFPKIPLFDILPGYIVRVRPEDFFIGITALVWLKEVYQKRALLNSTYLWFVGVYAAVGLSSILLGIFLIETIPQQLLHIGKSGLHFFRYMEYFSIFFFAHAAVTTQKRANFVVALTAVVIFLVTLFGIGQQYADFPVYSTMNREYSKGQTLYLQDGARPQSTFGGHYDLAAYLVITLPIIWATVLYSAWQKRFWYAGLLMISVLFGEYMLWASGSKTAFFAYIAGAVATTAFFIHEKKLWKVTLKWASLSFIGVTILGAVIFFIQPSQRQDVLTQKVLNQPQLKAALNLVSGTQEIGGSRPEDLDTDGHEFSLIATTSAEGVTTYIQVPNQSTWSENALKYGISMGIRLDTLWPQALRGFFNNPLFGNGYATLSKTQDQQFTEADSTDNNFLRTLGETGVLGFIAFYGLVIAIFIELARQKPEKDSVAIKGLRIGFLGAVLGIYINAIYIDVFAASKVAFIFWAYAGAALAATKVSPTITIHRIATHLKKHWLLYAGLIFALLLMHQNPLKEQSPLRDFAFEVSRVEQVTKAWCSHQGFGLSLCTDGQVIETQPTLYSWLLAQLFTIHARPENFYYLNMLLILSAVSLVYVVLRAVQAKLKEPTSFSIQLLRTSIFALSIMYIRVSKLYLQPLFDREIVLLFIALPIIVATLFWLISLLLAKYGQNKVLQLSIITITLYALIAQLPLDLKEQFRATQTPFAYKTAQRANLFFEKKNAAQPNEQYYLISTLSPFFFDFYRYTDFSPLPLSQNQSYDWALQNGKLFLTNYQVDNDAYSSKAFAEIKQAYDVRYEVLDCLEQCNIYSIQTQAPRISQVPQSITQKAFSLQNAQKPYQFAIISQEFEQKAQGLSPDTRDFIKKLNTLSLPQLTFAFLTGDITHKPEQSWLNLFLSAFGNLQPFPILFANGNLDTQPTKAVARSYYSFFTDTEYFLVLNLQPDGTLDTDQKLFVYNTFLELEKLPEIKTLFIVAHDLPALGTPGRETFETLLQTKLSTLPSISAHVFSHQENLNEPTQNISIQNESQNIQYHETSANHELMAKYALITVDAQGSALVETQEIQ